MGQSDNYTDKEEIAFIANFPGADPANNIIAVNVEDIPEPLKTTLSAALASNGTDSILVDSDSALDVSAATVPTEQQTPVKIEDTNGNAVDPITAAVLSSVGTDAVRVVSPQALDVSASEVDVDINSQSLSPLTVTDDGALDINSLPTPVSVNINSDNTSPTGTAVATGADISSGVSASVDSDSVTVYVENTGASSIDITISYSPDDGASYYPDPDGSYTLASGDMSVVEIGYDTTSIQVQGSNTETCNVHIVEA